MSQPTAIDNYETALDLLKTLESSHAKGLKAVAEFVRENERARLEAQSEASDANRDVESRDKELETEREAMRDAAEAYNDAVRELAELAHVAFPAATENALLRLNVGLRQAYAESPEPAPSAPYAVDYRIARAVNPPDPTPLLQAAMALRFAVRA